jgi:hypothetical protein
LAGLEQHYWEQGAQVVRPELVDFIEACRGGMGATS